MKVLQMLALGSLLITCATAWARPAVNIDQRPSPSCHDVYSISLATGDLDGQFNSIRVKITPDFGEFVNYNQSGLDGFRPLEAGAEQTFTNVWLLFPAPAGFGYSFAGRDDDGPTGISYTAGPLGSDISSAEPIFLNNIMVPIVHSFTGLIELIDTGVVLEELPFTLGFGAPPEPASTPPNGSVIDLRPAIANGTGMLESAVAVESARCFTNRILGVHVENDAFGLFGAAARDEEIDLSVDLAAGRQLPEGTIATADLRVETSFGELSYTLTARVPEPFSISLLDVSMIGLASARRR